MSKIISYTMENTGEEVEIEFDETTNMPTTPDGYFWELHQEFYWYTVRLRQKRKFWFSKVIKETRLSESKYVDQETGEYSADKFADEAQVCAAWISITYLDDIRKREKNWAEQARINKMMGKYPPKKLYN